MDKKIGMHRDFYTAIGMILFSGAVFVFSNSTIPGEAAYLPKMLAVFMLAMGAITLYNAMRMATKAKAENEPYTYKIKSDEVKIPLITFAMIAAYLLAFQYLGYYVATAIFLIALLRYLRAGSWKKIILITVGYTALCFLLFSVILHIPIYRVGLLGPLFKI